MSYEEGDITLAPPPPAFRHRWDVFLSFTGDDTRGDDFTDSLYTSFEKHGIRVFRDDDGLTPSDQISPDLLEAIEDSAASIVIISPNYASSRRCVEELAKICECRRLILPVFYGVDPSYVRQLKGQFEVPFRSLREEFEDEKFVRWKKAMEKAGGIAGYVFNNCEKPQLIQSLVKTVLSELSNTPVNVAPYTVGLDSRVEEVLRRFLDVQLNGTRILGLHGMGGVGKTTLAKALYNKLVSHFHCRSFISNVRETWAHENGCVSLQNKLMCDLSGVKVVPALNEVSAGVNAIKEIVRGRRVLIVLDDVGDISQLDDLAVRREWFYEGSRIIITTRDKNVLLQQHVNDDYEVRELDSSQALQLFSYHALRREKPTENFLNISEKIVSLTGGLPLALEVFGSFLFDKRRLEEWKDAVQKLERCRPSNLQDVLKISFDGLDEQQKCIFLDIACLFVQMNMKREDAIDILKGCGFMAEIAIMILTTKSLIKIAEGKLWMHDQLRDMGRQIVRHESLLDPGMRSRLWNCDEIMTVLNNKKGKMTQGIVLDFEKNDPSADTISWYNFISRPSFTSAVTYLLIKYKKYFHHGSENEAEVRLFTETFKSMVNLRLLQINHVKLEGRFNIIPAKLKWLQWKGCPLKSLPHDFCPPELTVLDISYSGIKEVWGRGWWGWYNNKVAEKLVVLNLRGCYNLIALPDLSWHPALEKIVLKRCHGLIKIHQSIKNATTLVHLDLTECSNLVNLPNDVSGLEHLEILILTGCSKLQKLPDNMGSMSSLRELLADKTAIAELPESILRLKKLEKLSLNGCQSMKFLPICIGELGSLRELSLNDSALEVVPDSIGSLEKLERLNLLRCSVTALPDTVGKLTSLADFRLNGTSLKELPDSIGSLYYLKDLSVGSCKYLSKLPISIGGLASIVELQLDGTPIIDLPDQIGNLKALKTLDMRSCESLKSLPESIGSILTLTTLIIGSAAITELPESIGMLENLIIMRLNGCKQLCKLPESIGKLKSLHDLLMEGTAVKELPENFGMLSNLMILKMAKKPYPEPYQSNVPAEQEEAKPVVLPVSFSNLSSLEELDARAWRICGKIPEDFKKLSSLEILNLSHNDFCSLPTSLMGLSVLKKLDMRHCKELRSLPPLPSSVIEVDAADCTALEYISDLSNLENLEELHLTNCEKIVDVPGLECMKSLRRLYMSGCGISSSAIKGRLSKAALKNIRNLGLPGTDIPKWFTREVVSFSKIKNRAIKGVLIGVVVSLNHQIPDDLRDQLPGIVDIQARILELNKPIFTTTLHLMGVPNTNEDQFHLCRFSHFHPLVSKLKDGYKIQVTKQNPPFVKGIELKKWGIHLVFEGDDYYDNEEDFLDESKRSVSERLANFFSSMECVSHSSDFKDEVEGQTQEMEESEERVLPKEKYSFIYFFVVLSSLFLLLSWLWLHYESLSGL